MDNESSPALVTPGTESDASEIGGKAHAIFRASALGLRIPESVVVPASWYKNMLLQIFQDLRLAGDSRFWHKPSASEWDEIRLRILAASIDNRLTNELTIWHSMLAEGRPGEQVVVRSSGNIEDSTTHSFAGIFETIIGSDAITEVISSVKRCWASVWSHRAFAYFERIHSNPLSLQMAVLIQRFIRPLISGVSFTCDPIHMDNSHIAIELAQFSCEMIVSGRTTPLFYMMRADERQVIGDLASDLSVRERDILKWVIDITLRIRELCKWPQKIEWTATAEGMGYILQIRPITTKNLQLPISSEVRI